ncbi:MAG: F0F1 ATP synthase subunit delta [Pseudomonadota bacterium]
MIHDFIDALYSLENINHEEILKELNNIQIQYEKNKMLHSRYVSSAIFQSFIANLIKSKNIKIITSLLQILYNKSLLYLLPEIIKSYTERTLSLKNTYKLYITSNTKLDEEKLNSIVNKLESINKVKFIPTVTINPSLISGVIIQYNEKYINLSGVFKLNNIQNNIINKLKTTI